MHQRLFDAQKMGVPHGTAHNSAQNVTAAFVRRQYTISKKKAGRAQMIGNNTMAGAVFTIGTHASYAF